MGLINRLFGSKTSNEDDKYVLFGALGSMLALSDGEGTKEEGEWVGGYLASVPGMTRERHVNIIKRAGAEGHNALNHAQKLNEDEKIELINFLIGVATADGYFHGEEAAFIFTFSIFLGFNKDQSMNICNHLLEEYDINMDEFNNACDKMKSRFNQAGF